MALSQDEVDEMKDIRKQANQIIKDTMDLKVINVMDQVVDFADKACDEDNSYYARLAKVNFCEGKRLTVEKK